MASIHWDSMKIQLSEPLLLPDLVGFLRDHGCLAYVIEDAATIVATVPDLPDGEDARAIRRLTAQWRFAHPLVNVNVNED
jgi:hypothetical protein